MPKRNIIIDCDPGIDDAVMLLLAFAAPKELEILGVTTVTGNLPLSVTARNARIVRELAGREEVPVYAGCPRPMLREPVEASEFHGKNGLGDIKPPRPQKPLGSAHAVDFIETTLLAAEEPVTLVVTGPFTNIAVAIVKNPEILAKVDEIVVMGGARSEAGNITPSAEFNIAADPHAAHVVFECGRPIVAFGLDVTHRAMATPKRIAALSAIGTPPAIAAAAMLDWVAKVEKKLKGYEGAPLHDPCTIAWLLKPKLFKTRPVRVDVETGSALTMGHTAVDVWGVTGRAQNASWAVEVDAHGLFALITERLKAL
jgi:purine nucleosidase